jgi:hypothetical protein
VLYKLCAVEVFSCESQLKSLKSFKSVKYVIIEAPENAIIVSGICLLGKVTVRRAGQEENGLGQVGVLIEH